jgi:hypothetical protein
MERYWLLCEIGSELSNIIQKNFTLHVLMLCCNLFILSWKFKFSNMCQLVKGWTAFIFHIRHTRREAATTNMAFRRICIVVKSADYFRLCPSFCLRVSTRFPLYRFKSNLILGTSKTMLRNPKFGQNQAKISDTWHEDLSMFYCCCHIKSPQKCFLQVKWYQSCTTAEVQALG